MPIILVIGAIIIAIGVGALLFTGGTNSETTRVEDTTPQISVTETVNESEPVPAGDEINDMTTTSTAPEREDVPTPTASATPVTLTRSATYLTPRRTEHTVAVTMTVTGDVVTDVSVAFDGKPEGEYSNDNQARFNAAYSQQVIGKSLNDISLSRVGGASLTSQAFNEAVEQISRDAA
jgi:hypothetical protein